MPVLMLAAALFAVSPSAQDANAALKSAIDAAGARQEPIVTPADKALINSKCGYAPGYEPKNINLNDGALVCENGKRVADAETKALEERISKRARAYANAVINDPGVKRAIEMVSKEATKEALEKVRLKFKD